MRKLLLISLLASYASSTFAADLSNAEGVSVTFDVLSYASQEFNVGYFSDNWSSGNRYELNILAQMDNGRVQPSGGVYIFYEERKWKGDTLGGIQESGDLECWGIGLQGGATISLLPQDRNLTLGLVPYARGGIGFQDYSARDVIISGSRYNFSSGSGRVEVGAGIDLRLTVAKKFEAVFGGGVDYWSGADIYLTAGSGGGGAYVGSNGTFSGTDAWIRFGAGMHF